MKILHTSDWHLGKCLENRERLAEQREVLNEVCQLVESRAVDLVLIAGDIFDNFLPTAAAEELFFDTIERLADEGRRGVVIIAGNHDSPERLCAAKQLAKRYGIVLLGLPKSAAVVCQPPLGGVQVVQSGAGWLELVLPKVAEHAVIIALPYPSEARLEEVLTQELDEQRLQEAYAEKVGWLFHELAIHFRPETVNLAMSHLFVLGGETTESERPIQLGGAPTVPATKLPAAAQYIALGHLHKPQKASGAKMPAYYSGSLLQYSFAEAGTEKAVMLVEAVPGQPAQIKKLPLKSGRPLVHWVARNGFEEAVTWCREGRDPEAWIDLQIYTPTPLNTEQNRTLRGLRPEIVNLWPVLTATETGEVLALNRRALPLPELFDGFYKSKTGGVPDPELVKLFVELALRAQTLEAEVEA